MTNTTPWATIGVWALTLLVAVVGGVAVIWGDGALTFERYLELLTGFGVAHGFLGIGRGINAGLTRSASIEQGPPPTPPEAPSS